MIMFFCFSSYSAYGLALCGVGTFFSTLKHAIRSLLDPLLSFVDSTLLYLYTISVFGNSSA